MKTRLTRARHWLATSPDVPHLVIRMLAIEFAWTLWSWAAGAHWWDNRY